MPIYNRAEAAEPRGHLVQLYGADERLLITNVAEYLWEGLTRGEAIIVIASQEHREAFSAELAAVGADPQSLRYRDQVTFLDAAAVLGTFMVDAMPEADLFDQTVGATVRELAGDPNFSGVRAYGEMVGVLWAEQQYFAATRLEQLWNDLMKTVDFGLFCGYPIDVFGKDFEIHSLDALLCAHDHLVPTAAHGDLDRAVDRALDTVLGTRADQIRPLIKANYRPAWATLPQAEATILWLRNNLPDYADDIVQWTREYFQGPVADPALQETA